MCTRSRARRSSCSPGRPRSPPVPTTPRSSPRTCRRRSPVPSSGGPPCPTRSIGCSLAGCRRTPPDVRRRRATSCRRSTTPSPSRRSSSSGRPPAAAEQPPPPPAARRRWWIPAAIAGGAVALVVAGVLVVRSFGDDDAGPVTTTEPASTTLPPTTAPPATTVPATTAARRPRRCRRCPPGAIDLGFGAYVPLAAGWQVAGARRQRGAAHRRCHLGLDRRPAAPARFDGSRRAARAGRRRRRRVPGRVVRRPDGPARERWDDGLAAGVGRLPGLRRRRSDVRAGDRCGPGRRARRSATCSAPAPGTASTAYPGLEDGGGVPGRRPAGRRARRDRRSRHRRRAVESPPAADRRDGGVHAGAELPGGRRPARLRVLDRQRHLRRHRPRPGRGQRRRARRRRPPGRRATPTRARPSAPRPTSGRTAAG